MRWEGIYGSVFLWWWFRALWQYGSVWCDSEVLCEILSEFTNSRCSSSKYSDSCTHAFAHSLTYSCIHLFSSPHALIHALIAHPSRTLTVLFSCRYPLYSHFAALYSLGKNGDPDICLELTQYKWGPLLTYLLTIKCWWTLLIIIVIVLSLLLFILL